MPYLFSYFVGEHDGLHLAWSEDGLKWEAFRDGERERIFLRPEAGRDKLMRDPCLLLGPDGIFRLVWTDSWGDQTLGYASSQDLITWSAQKTVPVMEDEPTTKNVWAPEVHYDAETKRYLLVWSSTIPGRFPETSHAAEEGLNHRFYFTTTTDFVTFAPARLLYDPGFVSIDATLLRFRGRVYLIFKDETLHPSPAKNLYLATSHHLDGPFIDPVPIKTKPAHWVEGPTAIEINGRVILYYDCYSDHHFGACASTDMVNWTDLTPELSLPSGIRHGTVLEVAQAVIDRLKR